MSTRTERSPFSERGKRLEPLPWDCDCDRVLSVVKMSEVIAGIGIWDSANFLESTQKHFKCRHVSKLEDPDVRLALSRTLSNNIL
jgi:hypothetical protein